MVTARASAGGSCPPATVRILGGWGFMSCGVSCRALAPLCANACRFDSSLLDGPRGKTLLALQRAPRGVLLRLERGKQAGHASEDTRPLTRMGSPNTIYAKGDDRKVALSRDKRFFRNAVQQFSPPSSLDS